MTLFLWIPATALVLAGLAFLAGRRTKKPALVGRPLQVNAFADDYYNHKALTSRSATPLAADHYKVALKKANGSALMICTTARGHEALQVFENVKLEAGETMKLFDGEVCRGEKRGG